jgi:hypothetical protein
MKVNMYLDEHDVFHMILKDIVKKYDLKDFVGAEVNWIDETDKVIDRELGIQVTGTMVYKDKK